MHEHLKNCPFCGGAPTTVERPDNIDGTQFFYAIACHCGRYSACAHKMAVRKTPEIAKSDVIAAWNTRTPQPTQAPAGADSTSGADKPVRGWRASSEPRRDRGDNHLALRGAHWGDVRLSQSLVVRNSFSRC